MNSNPALVGDPRAGRDVLLAAAGLILLVFVVYWPGLHGGFVRLDDYQYVVDNQLVRRPSGSGLQQVFAEVTRPSSVEGYYQPLTMMSLMLDVIVSGGDGLDPFPYHLTNVLLHAANSVLVMLLVRSIVGGLAVPFLVGMFFAVHPAQVESVAWISQRKTVLASFFAIASIAAYLKFGRTSRSRWLVAALAFYLISGLAKPTVMLLPLVLPLLDYWPLERPLVRSLREKWPFLIVMPIMGWVAWASQAESAFLQRATLNTPTMVLKWVGLLCYNLVLYAGNVLWPLHLSPYRVVPLDLTPANPAILLSIILTLAFLIVWVASRRASRPFFVGLAAFAIILAPALGPVRFMGSCVADRFVYLPLVFLMLPLAAMAKRFETGLHNRPWLVWGVLGLFALPLLVLTQAQQGVWRNSKTLWTHVADAVPDLPKANGNLALSALEEENFDDALEHIQRALKFEPDSPEYLHLLGRIYVRTGKAQEAVGVIESALKGGLGRVEATGYTSLAEAYIVEGDAEAAQQACEKALASGRTPAKTFADLGEVAMRFAGRYDLAADYFRKAIEREPDDVWHRWNLGTALHAAGRPAEALAEYEQVLSASARHGRPPQEMQAAIDKVRSQIAASTSRPTPASRPDGATAAPSTAPVSQPTDP